MEEGIQTVVKKITAIGFQCLKCNIFWRDDSFVSGGMKRRTGCPFCKTPRSEGRDLVLNLGEEEVGVEPPHRPEKCEGC